MIATSAPPMSQVEHGTFTIERCFAATPAQVFACWSTSEAKLRWFHCSDWGRPDHQLDFRVGGRETNRTGPPGGQVHFYDARYEDIVPDQRIVLAYTMTLGSTRISSSLLTIEFLSDGKGTRMLFTEQMVSLDPQWPVSSREEGTRIGLDNLAKELDQQAAR